MNDAHRKRKPVKFLPRASNVTVGTTLLGLFAFIGAMAYGWFINFMFVINASDETLTVLFGLRVVGIFVPPLGSVLGLFAG